MTVYVKRMLMYTQIALQPSNWRRILLGGLVMASKVWDDMAVWNVDFVSTSQGVDVGDLNLLERFYLTAMDFNVNVKASMFVLNICMHSKAAYLVCFVCLFICLFVRCFPSSISFSLNHL